MVSYAFRRADTPAQRRLPWERMQAEGLDRVVLWHRTSPTLLDWLTCIDPAQAICVLGYDGGDTLAGVTWLNPVMGLCACVHFCIFKAARTDWRNLSAQAVAWIFDQYPLAALTAIYPASYRHLDHMVRALGFAQSPLALPRACHMPTPTSPNRCRDAKIAALRRDQFRR